MLHPGSGGASRSLKGILRRMQGICEAYASEVLVGVCLCETYLLEDVDGEGVAVRKGSMAWRDALHIAVSPHLLVLVLDLKRSLFRPYIFLTIAHT